MPLTDTAIRQAKPAAKPFKLTDSGGMYLLVQPSGGRYWRMDYRHGDKRKTLAIGVYPDVPLKQARERRDEARRLLAEGIDPGEHRKVTKTMKAAEESFEAVAREWFAKQAPRWADGHSSKILQRLERDVFPWLGQIPPDTVTAPEILAVLRRIESRGALDTAHRAGQNIGQILRYAIATGRAERNPVADLKGALPPVKDGHHPALTDPESVGGLLRAVDAYHGHFIVRQALRLHPYLFTRPGELREARWAEIDLDDALWTIPGERMKAGQDHMVPLARQALVILQETRPWSVGGDFVFPTPRSATRPLSDMATSVAFKSMGFAGIHTPHGWRATARTLLDEALGIPAHLIEHQLAHSVRDPLGRAYNRTTHLPERRQMMQAWADYLDKLRSA
ncbi:MAG: integrase arm-type DNA-binding domain-containing protein [Magnetococcales bacterium]|nr:integrase arm-type DNA-binding domain-containing protein [Magnetococcales bacterium]